jgi:ABC-type sugar transport system substrate-binding protein
MRTGIDVRAIPFALLIGPLLLSGAAAQGAISVAASLPNAAAPLFNFMFGAMRVEASRLSNVTLVEFDAQDSASRQVVDLQNGIARGVNAFVVDPVDGQAVGPIIHSAASAGIRVTIVARPLSAATPDVTAQVLADFETGGKLQGQAVLADFPRGAKIINFEISPSPSEIERTNGLQSVLSSHANQFKLTNVTVSFNNILNPPVQTVSPGLGGSPLVFVCASDQMAVAVSHLLRQSGLPHGSVEVIGFDADHDGVSAIRSGEMAATVELFFGKQARQALDIAVAAARGGAAPSSPVFKVPPELITANNLGDVERQ